MKKIAALLAVAVIIVTVMFCFTGCSDKMEGYDESQVAFKVLQISDVHIKNNEKKDQKAFDTITAMIEEAKPDMIIVTGDVTSEHDNETAFKIFCPFIESFKIPWAFVFGNHDAEGVWSKEQISDYLDTMEYCIYERGDEFVRTEKEYPCMGNYYYNVKDADGKVIQTLFMMDSNMYAYDEVNDNYDLGYDNFHDDQIKWYEDQVKNIALTENGDETKVVPSLAFFHIPMTEFKTGYEAAKKEKKVLYGSKGIGEDYGIPYQDDDMFETMLRLGSTKGVFVGHDHMYNFVVDYKGIKLAYANSCDHNIYMVPIRGGNLITINKDGSYDITKLEKLINGDIRKVFIDC